MGARFDFSKSSNVWSASSLAMLGVASEDMAFDIIVDDSLHDYQGFFSNLKNFYPIVSSGGIYILEDLLL